MVGYRQQWKVPVPQNTGGAANLQIRQHAGILRSNCRRGIWLVPPHEVNLSLSQVFPEFFLRGSLFL
jgi:hypothetical protein